MAAKLVEQHPYHAKQSKIYTKCLKKLFSHRNLTRAGTIFIILGICVTQEVFLVLEMWERCMNRINFRTYEDRLTPVLLPALSVKIEMAEYLNYLLHHHPNRNAQGMKRTIRDYMLDCLARPRRLHKYALPKHESCLFSASYNLNITLFRLFDTLQDGDWSHDSYFKVIVEHSLNWKSSVRTTHGYVGRYMTWTFFTDSGTTWRSYLVYRGSAYNLTQAAKREKVFNPYVRLTNPLWVHISNSDLDQNRTHSFRYQVGLHSPANSYMMDSLYEWHEWDSTPVHHHRHHKSPNTLMEFHISHNTLIQKKCIISDTDSGPACREYFPYFAAGSAQALTEVSDPVRSPDWSCNLDSAVQCFTRDECSRFIYYQNPNHDCLQYFTFKLGISFNLLKTALRSRAKGVACGEDGRVSREQHYARMDYAAEHNNAATCPMECRIPVHTIQHIATIRKGTPSSDTTQTSTEPRLKLIIGKSLDQPFLTSELFPYMTNLQLIPNMAAVVGIWFGVSVYGGLLRAPLLLTKLRHYIQRLMKPGRQTLVALFTPVAMRISSLKISLKNPRRDDLSRPPPFRVNIKIPKIVFSRPEKF